MNRVLYLRDRQRTRKLDRRFLRRVIRSFVEEDLNLDDFELVIHILGTDSMTRLNQEYLSHRGSTDVITFGYDDPGHPEWLGADIFVCLPEAIAQARRFRTTWQQELVRYVVHGILHLRGYDDHAPTERKKMKKAEDTHVHRLTRRFLLRKIGGHSHS